MLQSEDCGQRGDITLTVLTVSAAVALAAGLVIRFAGTAPTPGIVDLILACALTALVVFALSRRQSGRLRGRLAEHEQKARSVHRELAELASIFEVSSRVNSFQDVEGALRFIVHMTRECLDADRSCVYMKSGDLLVMRAAAGDRAHDLDGVDLTVGQGLAGWVASHRRPLLLNRRRDVRAFQSNRPGEQDVASAICVPLRLKGEPLGVLEVHRFASGRRPDFEDRHQKLLSIFADYAANTIHSLRMYTKVHTAHSRLEKSYRELKVVQDQLVQAEKLSTIGQLISEVSHELNNPLTTTVGYAQLLARVNTDPEIAEYLENIRSEGLRCKRIIGNLLDFARKNRGERNVVDVNELVEKTISLRRYQLSIDGIEVDLDLGDKIPPCFADPSRLQQVFLNLLNNAQQAISNARGKGRILFTTRYRSESRRIDVAVSDDGPGVPEGLEKRIFEPFYTTKPASQGTGLGLPVCRGFVEELGGRILIGKSREGGALFLIELPSARNPKPRIRPEDSDKTPIVRGKRILVVDDDEQVRGLLARTLCLDEHEVHPVESGAAALDEIEANGFDLVLSDLRMPGMSGIDLYRAIHERDEDLAGRVVFFSGATISDEYRDFFRRTGRTFMQKPFGLDEVRQSIYRALAQEETTAVRGSAD